MYTQMQKRWSHTRVCGWQRCVKLYQIPQLHDSLSYIWMMKCCSLATFSFLLIQLSHPFILPYLAVPHTAAEGVLIRWLFLTKSSDSKRRQFSKRKHADMSFITVRSLTSGISLLPCALYVPFVFLALWHARLSSSGCVSRTALPGSHANLAFFSFSYRLRQTGAQTKKNCFILLSLSLCNKIHNYTENEHVVCMCFLVMWFFTLFKQAQTASLNILRFYSNLGLTAFAYIQTASNRSIRVSYTTYLHIVLCFNPTHTTSKCFLCGFLRQLSASFSIRVPYFNHFNLQFCRTRTCCTRICAAMMTFKWANSELWSQNEIKTAYPECLWQTCFPAPCGMQLENLNREVCRGILN